MPHRTYPRILTFHLCARFGHFCSRSFRQVGATESWRLNCSSQKSFLLNVLGILNRANKPTRKPGPLRSIFIFLYSGLTLIVFPFLCYATQRVCVESFVFVIQFVFCVGGLKCSFPSLEDNNDCGVRNYLCMELTRYVNSQDSFFFLKWGSQEWRTCQSVSGRMLLRTRTRRKVREGSESSASGDVKHWLQRLNQHFLSEKNLKWLISIWRTC